MATTSVANYTPQWYEHYRLIYVPVVSVVSVAIVIISPIIGVSPSSSPVVMLEISTVPNKERSTKGQSQLQQANSHMHTHTHTLSLLLIFLTWSND